MNTAWPRSLTTRTLLQLGIAVGLIIILAACGTYYLVFRAAEERGLVHLRQYLGERVLRVEKELAEVPRNLAIARDAYVKRYAQADPPGFMENWDRLYEKNADGAWRSKKEFSNDFEYGPLWAHKDVGPSPDFKRRILIMNEICDRFLPGWVHGFRSLYGFTQDEMAVIGFDPALAGWIYVQAADYAVNEQEFGIIALPANNPARTVAWSGTTSNDSNTTSLVSVVLPIDIDGRHVISLGHDLVVENLIDEAARTEIPGAKHMIFREDGHMIACPGRAREIYEGQGKLNMKTASDPVWRSLYAAIQGKTGRQFEDYDKGTDLHYAGRILAGPGWIYLTTMPRSLLRAEAFQSTRWVLWSALASLALELVLLGVILRRSVARPIADLVDAARRLEAGETDISVAMKRKDELGELAAAFTDMANKVRQRDAALREEKAGLESRVTERTAELERALAQQTELARLKSDFVSLVSHEFRTPLGVIMSAADVLRLFFNTLSEDKRMHHLEMITRSTRSLAGLIEEVLLIRKVEDGRMRFEPVAVDVPTICRVLADEIGSTTHQSSPIHFSCDAELAGAKSDETLLRHILSNVLSNAVKYSEPGQPVDFRAERKNGDVVFTVQDHGIGILPEDRSRLFHSFTRGRNVGSRPGTGLGLIVVKRCVDLHGGELNLQSEPGAGTTVTIALPVFNHPESSP